LVAVFVFALTDPEEDVVLLKLLPKPPGGGPWLCPPRSPTLVAESSFASDDVDTFADREPNLRSLFAYEKIALLNSASPNSGHMASVKYNSVYAISNNIKFDKRCSPEVRISKSGFCNDLAARRLDKLPFSCCCAVVDDGDADVDEDEALLLCPRM
jgi:hypothetical protein